MHCVNPEKASWTDLLPSIQQGLKDTRVVPWTEWVDTFLAAAEKDNGNGSLTGFKLRPFFEGMGEKANAELDTVKTKEHSATLRNLKPVNADWMARWMKQWGYVPTRV